MPQGQRTWFPVVQTGGSSLEALEAAGSKLCEVLDSGHCTLSKSGQSGVFVTAEGGQPAPTWCP